MAASTPIARRRPISRPPKPRCRPRSSISATPKCARRWPAGSARLEITVGNLIAAGPGAPVLTTLVSVNPIYASFNADEQVVTRALRTLAEEGAPSEIGRIPVQMGTAATDGTPYTGGCS